MAGGFSGPGGGSPVRLAGGLGAQGGGALRPVVLTGCAEGASKVPTFVRVWGTARHTQKAPGSTQGRSLRGDDAR